MCVCVCVCVACTMYRSMCVYVNVVFYNHVHVCNVHCVYGPTICTGVCVCVCVCVRAGRVYRHHSG